MQGSDFDDDEFDVGTLRYHPSNMFRPQYGIEEDTFSEYSVDHSASRRPLRSRPPIDFSSNWQHSHPPSLTSSSMAYSSLGSIVAPKAASTTRSPRFSPEDIASLTIPELCHNAHYCELRDNHDYTSRVLAQYLGKDLRVGEHRAPRGANGSRTSDIYRSMLLVLYEVYSLNHIPQHYDHTMRTPRHHLWRQAIRYPSFRKVHNSMQQPRARSPSFSMQWTRHQQSGQITFHRASCGTFEIVQRISGMATSLPRPTRVDQRCNSLSAMKTAHWFRLTYTITCGCFLTCLFVSSSRNSTWTVASKQSSR